MSEPIQTRKRAFPMRKTDISVQELVDMIERGDLRLPEMQRQFVWKATRVRDLIDSLYRGYPSGSILVWETNEKMPVRDLAVEQKQSPFSGHKLLLDGQQRLTSLSAVIRGAKVTVRNRQKKIDILFNLDHLDKMVEVTEVDDEDEQNPDDEQESDESEDDESEDEEETKQFASNLAFVVANNKVASLPSWVSVTEVFKTASNAKLLMRAGVTNLEDPRHDKYNERLERLRGIKNVTLQPFELAFRFSAGCRESRA